MNNIRQKNVIYSLKPNTELPYKHPEYVAHNYCCENINEVDVNNLAGQLVDNDLYVESYLQHASSYVVGPKMYDQTTISSKVNGYKSFGAIKSSDTLEIMRKIDTPLSATVSKLQSGNTKVLKKFGDLVIANIDGITKCTYDPLEGIWEMLCCNENGDQQTVDVIDVYSDGIDCFFAAKTGIYQLSTSTQFNDALSATVEDHALVKLNNDSEDIDACCIAVNRQTKTVYVGSRDNNHPVRIGQINLQNGLESYAGKITLVDKNLYSNQQMVVDKINDIEVLSGGDVIVAGNTSLYVQSKTKYLQGMEILAPASSSGVTQFTSCVEFYGRMFFGSSRGLWVKELNGTTLEKVTALGEINILKMALGTKNLYIASNDKIFEFSPSFTISKTIDFANHGTIQSIVCVDNIVLVATEQGLHAFDSSLANPFIFQVKADVTSTKDMLYKDGYLAIASSTGLSSMVLVNQGEVELPTIESLREVDVVGIDGSDGNSGFLKFIRVFGTSIAVFKTKIVSLGADKSKFSPLSGILDAIPLNINQFDQCGYFAVACQKSTMVIAYDGAQFSLVDSMSEPSGFKHLAQVGDLLVGQVNDANNTDNTDDTKYLFSWSLGNLSSGLPGQWVSTEVTNIFTDLVGVGLCAIGQVESTGLSGFSKISMASQTATMTIYDACAVNELSTQFIAGDGSTKAKAYIVSSLTGSDEGIAAKFSIVDVGEANAKRIQCVKFDGEEDYYAYILDNNGTPYLYQLSSLYTSNQILSGFQSINVKTYDKVASDVQMILEPTTGNIGAIFSGSDGVYTHIPMYGTPSSFASGNSTYAIAYRSEGNESEDGTDTDEIVQQLVFTNANSIKTKDLVDGEEETAFTFSETLQKAVPGMVGVYALGSHLSVLYGQEDIPNVYEMNYNGGPALVKDILVNTVYGVGKDSSENPVYKTYDIVVAAVGSTIHCIKCDGTTPTDFSDDGTLLPGGDLGEEILNIDYFKMSSPDILILACTSSKLFLFRLTMTLDEDTGECSIAALKTAQYDLSITASSAFLNNDCTAIVREAGAGNKALYKIRFEVGSGYAQFAGELEPCGLFAKALIKSTRIDNIQPDVWYQSGTKLAQVSGGAYITLGTSGIDAKSISISREHGIFIACGPNGVLKTTKTLTSDLILNKSISNLKSVGYASGFVFVVGQPGLSCYQYSDGDSAALTCLNDSTAFTRCYASSQNNDTKVEVVAWTQSKVYRHVYQVESFATNSLTESDVIKTFGNINIETIVAPNDQLQLQATYTEDGGAEDLIQDNIFMHSIISTSLSYDDLVFGAQNRGVYLDNGAFQLSALPVDNDTKVSKFIRKKDGGLWYLDSNKTKVFSYPQKDLVKEWSSAIEDAVEDGDGIWYFKSHGSWKYDPDGLTLPNVGSNTVSQLGDAIKQDGVAYLGTEYGLLSAKYVKTEMIIESPSFPLQQKHQFGDEENLSSLNYGIGHSVIAVASTAEKANVYKIPLDSSGGGVAMQFYPPESSTGSETVATLVSAWCINNDFTKGMLCKAKSDDNYAKWLNYINGETLEPFTNVSVDALNCVAAQAGKNLLLSNDSVVSFTRYGDEVVFQSVVGSQTTSAPYSHLVATGAQRAIVLGGTGIQTYSNGQTSTLKDVGDKSVGALNCYDLEGKLVFAHNLDQTILTSQNYKIWKPLLTLSSNEVNDIQCLNKRTYLFATPNGLYGTRYSYVLSNDIVQITKDQALEMYNDIVQRTLSSELSSALCSHVSTSHLSSSLISRLNEDFSTVQLDDIVSSWQDVKISSDNAASLGIKNDIIAEMTFGRETEGDVIVQISNYLDDEDASEMQEVSSASFIAKRWMSGLTELFINVPTTRTYYLNNLLGASNCKIQPTFSSSRKNLEDFGFEKMEQTGELSTHYTTVKVGLTSAEYNITKLLDVQINGMSLPLKIYQEDQSSLPGKLYSSFIEPSVMKSYNTTTTDEDGNWLFTFACFGTDAQAIHLMFYDEKARSNSAVVKVLFDPNGGDGTMAAQKFILITDDDGYPVLEQKSLKKNKFTNTSTGYDKIFAGWSIAPLPDNEEAAYEDKMMFPSSSTWSQLSAELQRDADDVLKHKDEITLYAVWLTYQFNENDTTLVMNSNKTEFQIADVGIDESTNLKDKVVINWGD